MVEPTNLGSVTNFSNAIRARLRNLPAFRRHIKDDALLAKELAKAVMHALEQEEHPEIEVTSAEAYQWLAAQDIPRDDERGEAIYDALVEVLELDDNAVTKLNSLHSAALTEIEASEKLCGRTETLMLPAKGAAKAPQHGKGRVRYGLGSYGRAAGGSIANFYPSHCYETVHYPAIPPRMIILPDSHYADNYDRMRPEEWEKIAESTENFFELLCCLRRMVEPKRHVFSQQNLDSALNHNTVNQHLMYQEHGQSFPSYRNDNARGPDIVTLKVIFSKNPDTKKYAEKFERLFVKNKIMNAAYTHQQGAYIPFGLNLLYLPPHCYVDALLQCNNRKNGEDSTELSETDTPTLPIYEKAYYFRMTRNALGLDAKEVAKATNYAERSIQQVENPETQRKSSVTLRNELSDYYENKQTEWLEKREELGEEPTAFFDRGVYNKLPNLTNAEISAQWQADNSEFFARIKRNVEINSQVAEERSYESRKKPENGEATPKIELYAHTVTGDGCAAGDKLSKEL